MAKIEKGYIVKIPENIAKDAGFKEGEDVDFEVKENAIVIRKKTLTQKEIEILKKINRIKFAERTKGKVASVLSSDELKILDGLLKRQVVLFYEGGKYKGHGVYSISRDYYQYVIEPKKEKRKNLIEKYMGKKKYMIITDVNEAKNVLTQLESEIARGEVVTVRGFDKKFYVATKDVVDDVGSCLIAALESGELTLDELAERCGVEKGLCKAVVEILRESGDIIEKRKELYALA